MPGEARHWGGGSLSHYQGTLVCGPGGWHHVTLRFCLTVIAGTVSGGVVLDLSFRTESGLPFPVSSSSSLSELLDSVGSLVLEKNHPSRPALVL